MPDSTDIIENIVGFMTADGKVWRLPTGVATTLKQVLAVTNASTGQVEFVTLTKTDLGLGNVSNVDQLPRSAEYEMTTAGVAYMVVQADNGKTKGCDTGVVLDDLLPFTQIVVFNEANVDIPYTLPVGYTQKGGNTDSKIRKHTYASFQWISSTELRIACSP
jgi:hypothetical protein